MKRDRRYVLIAKVLLFTAVVPGTVTVIIPVLLVDGPVLDRVSVFGLPMLGVLPIVLGLALYERCASAFITSGKGTPAPIDPPRELVIEGPYRYNRNPMYVGVLSILSGEAILMQSRELVVYTISMALLFHLVIVLYEERALVQKFGSKYREYCRNVPRWLPSLAGLRSIHSATFLKVGAFVLAAGSVAHLVRLTIGLPVTETPDSIHAYLFVLPLYAASGCLLYRRRIRLKSAFLLLVYWLTTLLLLVTAVMHAYSILAQTNRWLGVFPNWYSVVAMIGYGLLAVFLVTRDVAPEIET